MLQAAAAKTRVYDVLITGGVASSELLRQLLTERRAKARAPLNLHFGRQDLSGDNAVGVALIGVNRYMRSQGTEP